MAMTGGMWLEHPAKKELVADGLAIGTGACREEPRVDPSSGTTLFLAGDVETTASHGRAAPRLLYVSPFRVASEVPLCHNLPGTFPII